MPLKSGTRIGGYEIVSLLGAGGMGEVYRARDTRLGRDVAVKVLSPRIAADRDAVLRFEREARALATLNHPNVAAIYDVIESAGQPALVLELVDGATLADRIAVGTLSIDEAIGFAKQIADALDAAHEAGIVHRDLKPGNIKVTDAGQIKVLDFGLAKAVAAATGQLSDIDPTHSPTITVHGTRQGVILGTAAYMSPEQARGKRIDKRTDIWAFGCVLFEMLSGKRAFNGETTSDVIAAIIERAPDLSALPASTPSHVRRVIERCVEKDPKRRARDIADVRVDLDRVDAAPSSGSPRRAIPLIAAAAALISLAAGGFAAWRWRPAPATPPTLIEFTVAPPDGYSLTGPPGVPSPDGSRIAFIARDEQRVSSLFVRSLDAPDSRRLEGTAGVSSAPEWSPDGSSIAFFAGDVWKRIAADGGPAVTIVSGVGNLGASWGPGDVFLLAPANRTSLSRVQATGGSLQQVTTLDTAKDNSHRWPQLLPDGRHYLFTVRSDSPERLGIKLGDLGSAEMRPLVNVASQGSYAASGWLLFVTPDQVLMAQRLDPSTWTLQGTPQPILGRVRYNGPSFEGAFSVSSNGRVLSYLPAAPTGSTLEWFDRTGKPLGRVGPERAYRAVRLSPDARHIAVELADERIGTRDIWLIDTSSSAITRLTSNPATDWRPVFSPDGSSIAFASDRAGASSVFRTLTNGSGGDRAMFRHPEGGAFPLDWSRDGNRLLLTFDDAQGRNPMIAQVPIEGGAAATFRNLGDGGVVQSRYSPSGDRIAFVQGSGQGRTVHVMSVSNQQQRVRVSTEEGFNPVWAADGRELFFQNARSEIMHARIDGTTITSPPAVLFRPCVSINRIFGANQAELPYDVSRDGRFLVNCLPADALPSAIHVIVNWQSRLK